MEMPSRSFMHEFFEAVMGPGVVRETRAALDPLRDDLHIMVRIDGRELHRAQMGRNEESFLKHAEQRAREALREPHYLFRKVPRIGAGTNGRKGRR